MKRIDVEGLKKLLKYLNHKGFYDCEDMLEEIEAIKIDGDFVDFDIYSFSILEEVEE